MVLLSVRETVKSKTYRTVKSNSHFFQKRDPTFSTAGERTCEFAMSFLIISRAVLAPKFYE